MRTLCNSQRWRPLFLENVQADTAVGVDVGMVNLGLKADFGRFEGVICREVDIKEEHASSIR